MENPIRLQGQYEDEETGLCYNRFRYYDSVGGLYVSADPIGLGAGENVYAFAPNIFGWSDPLGLKCGTDVIQQGGHTIRKSTANALNEFAGTSYHSREWGRALEALKKFEGLGNAHHGKILRNADYTDSAGQLLGNLLDYL